MNTTIRKVTSILCLLAAALLFPSLEAERKAQDVEIELCDFQVAPEIARANASFSVIYSVDVGEDGKPVRVEKKKNEFLADQPFVSCIENWRLPAGIWIVTLSWKHGKGWIEITISGNDLNYHFKIPVGVSNQYGRPVRK